QTHRRQHVPQRVEDAQGLEAVRHDDAAQRNPVPAPVLVLGVGRGAGAGVGDLAGSAQRGRRVRLLRLLARLVRLAVRSQGPAQSSGGVGLLRRALTLAREGGLPGASSQQRGGVAIEFLAVRQAVRGQGAGIVGREDPVGVLALLALLTLLALSIPVHRLALCFGRARPACFARVYGAQVLRARAARR